MLYNSNIFVKSGYPQRIKIKNANPFGLAGAGGCEIDSRKEQNERTATAPRYRVRGASVAGP